jgi:hypothetical protein
MSSTVREILDQIDRLDESQQEELRTALRLRSRAQWEKLAEDERQRTAGQGISEPEVDAAVAEVRYGKKRT